MCMSRIGLIGLFMICMIWIYGDSSRGIDFFECFLWNT